MVERSGIKEAIYKIIVNDMSRFASDIVFDIAGEVSIPGEVKKWVEENINVFEIEEIADEIMKDPKLREKWKKEYETCMVLVRSHKYCVSVASTSVVRDYFSSEEITKKLLDWVGRYLKEKVPPLIGIRVETEKELISETRAPL